MVKAPDDKKAFSLIEILFVTVILVVIAGLSVPNFSKTHQKFQFKEAANHLSFLMRYAQHKAVTSGRTHRLEFNDDLSEYRLTVKDEEESSEDKETFNSIPGSMGKVFEVPGNAVLESEFRSIDFYDNGKIEKARMYLCLKDSCITISTKEQSGYVQIFDFKLDESSYKL